MNHIPILARVALATAFLLAAPATVSAQDGVGYRFAFGWQQAGGELGDALDGAVDAEFSILVPVGPLRLGGGANWASLEMDDEDASWNQVRFHGLVGYPLQLGGPFRPYAEARVVFRRLRPEDDRFYGAEEEELLRDFSTTGTGLEGVVGTEVILGPRVSLDFSGALSSFSLSPDLSEEGLGAIDSGSAWRLHAGLSWFPTNGR